LDELTGPFAFGSVVKIKHSKRRTEECTAVCILKTSNHRVHVLGIWKAVYLRRVRLEDVVSAETPAQANNTQVLNAFKWFIGT